MHMRRYKRSFKNNFFGLFLIIVFCISVGYAVLSKTLAINGNSEVKKNTWDIHFENIQLTNGSVETASPPTLDNNNPSVSFAIALDLPGDFYEFTVDVVNAGTIDAMIDSINKTPELTVEQAKYLNYVIEYQNGEQITKNQLVSKDSFVRLKVRVEYKKDITASDLPTTSETLNLGFTLNYVQSDGNSIEVVDSGVCSHSTYENGYCTVCGQPQSYNVKLFSEGYGVEIVGNPVAYHGQDLVVEFKNTVSESLTNVLVDTVETDEELFVSGYDGITFVDNILTIPGRFVTSDILIDAFGLVAVKINLNGGEITEEGIKSFEFFGGTWNPETSIGIIEYGLNVGGRMPYMFAKTGYTFAGVKINGELVNTVKITEDQIWDVQWTANSTS